MLKRMLSPLLALAMIGLPLASAQDKKEAERLDNCGTVLKEILDIPDDIPQDLLDKSECVIGYPSVLKAAFVIGGSYGRGAMSCRTGEHYTGPWSAPTMMALEGGSIGFQIGGQATDFVLLVMNSRGAHSILSSKVKLGADASVAAGPKGRTANASTDVSVEQKPNTPPTITCSADPATITVGQRSSITANATDVDNDKLTYSYKASGGTVSGTGANAQFDSTGVAPGNYTVTCHVSDGRGGETEAITQVAVQPAPPTKEQVQLEQRLSLHSIYFATAKPTVINPDGGLVASQQRTLVALASDFMKYLAFKPEAHLILQGHADPRGGEEYNKLLSDRRVVRTKAFLVQQGLSAGAIDTQGLGEEQPMSADQVKQAIDQEQDLSAAQKTQLSRNARVLALAQSRRVDVTLSTTGQTSVRKYPFNAEDALTLINPKGTGTAAAKKAAPKAGTPKAGTPKKKAPAKKQ